MNHKLEIQFHLIDEDGNEVKNIPAGILSFIANELENTESRQGELQTSVNGVSYSGWWRCGYQTDDLGHFVDQRLTLDEEAAGNNIPAEVLQYLYETEGEDNFFFRENSPFAKNNLMTKTKHIGNYICTYRKYSPTYKGDKCTIAVHIATYK